MQTEFHFTLPKGYLDERGALHKSGTMRLATARDEIDPLTDPRVRDNEAYLVVLLLAQVIVRLGNYRTVTPAMIERMFAADIAYLQEFYHYINDLRQARPLLPRLLYGGLRELPPPPRLEPLHEGGDHDDTATLYDGDTVLLVSPPLRHRPYPTDLDALPVPTIPLDTAVYETIPIYPLPPARRPRPLHDIDALIDELDDDDSMIDNVDPDMDNIDSTYSPVNMEMALDDEEMAAITALLEQISQQQTPDEGIRQQRREAISAVLESELFTVQRAAGLLDADENGGRQTTVYDADDVADDAEDMPEQAALARLHRLHQTDLMRLLDTPDLDWAVLYAAADGGAAPALDWSLPPTLTRPAQAQPSDPADTASTNALPSNDQLAREVYRRLRARLRGTGGGCD